MGREQQRMRAWWGEFERKCPGRERARRQEESYTRLETKSGLQFPHEVLGVSRNATQKEVTKAYRKLAMEKHPDRRIGKGVPEPVAREEFQDVLNAYLTMKKY